LAKSRVDARELVRGLAIDVGNLLGVGVKGRVALAGRVNNEVNHDLTLNAGAERDGGELVQLLLDFVIEVVALKVASPPAALTDHAL